MSDHQLCCTITHYDVVDGKLSEITTEETTSYRISSGWLYLDNSAASAWLNDVLRDARAGRGWTAQAGISQVLLDGRWAGRVWPKIYVSADALLELEEVIAK